ncbi:MAG: hypothetical protein VX641_03930 [Planctomycetota bacterium]|nr:hypothetical protein [Planctomycetota bacterium]
MNINSLIILAGSACLTVSAHADIIDVPGDHPTIEAAVEAALEGDEIRVGPGVWYENLFISKQITITGSGQGVTIIDGSQPQLYDFGSCLVVTGFNSQTNEPFRLQSLTLRGGSGAAIYGVIRGGGIYSEFAAVELNAVTITHCSVERQSKYDSMGWGGAICNYGGEYVINDSLLSDNRSFSHGGAIYSYGSIRLTDTLVTSNTADLTGGGVYTNLSGSDASFLRTSICGNQSRFGGGVALADSGTLRFDACRLTGNLAEDGAALHMDETASVIAESSFVRNATLSDDGSVIRIIDQPGAPGVLSVEVYGSLFCGANQGDWQEFIVETEPNEFLDICAPPGDLDHDGMVTGSDLSILLSRWGDSGMEAGADLDCDGVVSGPDLSVLLANWSAS